MNKIKKILTLAMTATLLFSSMTVNAASTSITAKQNADYMMSLNKDGVPNWFSGTYYSGSYADLKVAFGTNEKALYNHSLHYGFQEYRLVTPVLDVAKYRAYYPDLDQVFGNNWKLYVRHYFEYGIAEGRENFTDFDARTYLNMYEDLQNAFGTDLGLATRHYIEYGLSEAREYNWPEPEIKMEFNNNDDNSDDVSADDSSDSSLSVDDTTEEVLNGDYRIDIGEGNGYFILTYVNDVLTIEKMYDANNVLSCVNEYENGNVIKYSFYEDGMLESWEDCEYNSNNQLTKSEIHIIDSDLIVKKVYIYDDNGNQIEVQEYYDDNYVGKNTMDYYSNGNIKSRTSYNGIGIKCWFGEYDENDGYIKIETCYHADGITPSEIITYDESYNEITHKYYDEQGVEINSGSGEG